MLIKPEALAISKKNEDVKGGVCVASINNLLLENK